MQPDDLIRPWRDALDDAVPGLSFFDAHTHTGSNDPDGMRQTPEELLEALARARVTGAVVFTMHEPGGYSEANDRILAEAAASDGKLVPYCRLNPRDDPVAEAERCLGAGARGIKLHPRAEEFRLADPRADGIFALAHERKLPVIVHAGRGIPALGRDALDLAGRYPDARIILAHAGVSDLAWIWRQLDDHPNVFFDSAWWSPIDLLTLFSHVPPSQIVWGSDSPYGTPALSVVIATRCALQAGLSGEQFNVIAGEQMKRLLDNEDPIDLGPPPGVDAIQVDLLLERISTYLVTSFGRLMLGDSAPDYIGLARLACEVGDDTPQAAVCRSVLALLDRFERFGPPPPPPDDGRPPGPATRFPGLGVVLIASVVARTPDVALPEEPEPVEVGERTT
ncbi:MAG: amidohydrolase family protein [Thermoleophilaceae bacterium]